MWLVIYSLETSVALTSSGSSLNSAIFLEEPGSLFLILLIKPLFNKSLLTNNKLLVKSFS